MELHVLGPAFGLPSIDAECIAAVALLRLRLSEGWTIVPTHDQTRRLPYLLDNNECIDGFKNIARHIERSQEAGSSELDSKQRADSTAISSFVSSNAQTFLDLSLYVSFENYSATRTAFTKILPWHANYIVPPSRRKSARMRTQHLGISSMDVDDVHEDLSNRPSGFDVGKEKTFEAETQKRASVLLPQKNTVRSLLQRPEHSSIFKLHALADNFFEPLQEMLGENEYFLGTDEPQQVDCLAYGYLSLMLYPQMPQDWLAKTLRKKYAKLVQYTERMHERLQMQTDIENVMALAECKSEEEVQAMRRTSSITLPWAPPASAGIVEVASTIARDLISRIPLLGPSTELIPATPSKQTSVRRYLPAIIVTTTATIGLFGCYAFTTGLLIWPRGEEVHIFGRKRLADYGHLGAALAGVSLLGQQARQNAMVDEAVRDGDGVIAEVEVEIDKKGVP